MARRLAHTLAPRCGRPCALADCAPTRGAFLTGRLPYKLAATRANFIPWTLPDGTHLGYAMLPKKLAAAGYVSYREGTPLFLLPPPHLSGLPATAAAQL